MSSDNPEGHRTGVGGIRNIRLAVSRSGEMSERVGTDMLDAMIV